MNILDQRYETGFSFPIYCSATWTNGTENGYGNIECTITIFIKDDIDGEGWISAVINNSLEDVKKNKGFNFKLLGVDVVLEKVIVNYKITSSYKNEEWNRTYYNCSSLVSRADLNYDNLEDAILRDSNGKGAAIDIPIVFNYSDDMTAIFTKYNVNSNSSHLTDPLVWTLSNLKRSKDPNFEKVVLDLKKEMVVGGGISNGYIGLADIAKQAQAFYIGIDNIAREIIKIYVGDQDNKARAFYSNSGGDLLKVEDMRKIFLIRGQLENRNPVPVYGITDYPSEWYNIYQHSFFYIPSQCKDNIYGKKDFCIDGQS